MAVGAGKGGIGGSGRGWSGSGNESRSAAAHAGANVGRSSGGGDRGGGNRSGSNTSTNTRGPDSVNGANRRQSAVDSFTNSVKGAMKGFANSLGFNSPTGMQSLSEQEQTRQDFNQQIDAALGINTTPSINQGFLSPEWSSTRSITNPESYNKFASTSFNAPMANPATQAEAEKAYGARKALEATAASTVTGPGTLYKAYSDYMGSGYLSGPGQAGYEDVNKRATGSWGKTAVKSGLGLLKMPVPAPVVDIGFGVLNTIRAADYAEQRYGVDFTSSQQNRRDNALNAFRGGESSKLSSVTNTTPTQTQYSTWEPASYGVGNYGSHLKGLLS